MKTMLYLLSSASLLLLSQTLIKAETLLVNMEPEIVWGSYLVDDTIITRTGEKAENMIIDYGAGSNFLYAGGRKIVKEIPKDYKFQEGQIYQASNLDVFAVGGEFVTGVGLLTRQFNMYYDATYNIPAGAKEFKSKLLISDYAYHYTLPGTPINQQSVFVVYIDEKEVFRIPIARMTVAEGSGESLDEVTLKIPDGAKKIRFNLESSGWGDQGSTELILNEGKFIP
ncbi:MAG: hypothetical protein SGI98_11425 [Verrucomicrobiota bacterium]|nr:hypothetical protein [Verrucomicrobiota bacterium]